MLFNKTQLVERNRAHLYSRLTAFLHAGYTISAFIMTWYTDEHLFINKRWTFSLSKHLNLWILQFLATASQYHWSHEGGMCACVGREEVTRTYICMYWTSINLQDRLIDYWQKVTTDMVHQRSSGRLSNYHDKGTGAPNDGFLRNTLKTLFRLSRVRAIKFVSLQST